MRKITVFMLTAIFALATAGASAVFADEDGKWYSGELKAGATYSAQHLSKDEDGAKGGTEYNAVIGKRATTYLGGNLELSKNGYVFTTDDLYRDVYDQSYEGFLSLKRAVIFKTDYLRFYHRLDHDYMDNLNAHVFPPASTGWKNWASSPDLQGVNGLGTVGTASVYNTDLNPDEQYGVARALWKNEVKFNIPQIPELKLRFNHRFEQRKGEMQATPGMYISDMDLKDALRLASEDSDLVYLKEDGDDVRVAEISDNSTFVLGDSEDLSPAEESILMSIGAKKISLGPTHMHTWQAIAVMNYELDRRWDGSI
jgi:hypothetical protein